MEILKYKCEDEGYVVDSDSGKGSWYPLSDIDSSVWLNPNWKSPQLTKLSVLFGITYTASDGVVKQCKLNNVHDISVRLSEFGYAFETHSVWVRDAKNLVLRVDDGVRKLDWEFLFGTIRVQNCCLNLTELTREDVYFETIASIVNFSNVRSLYNQIIDDHTRKCQYILRYLCECPVEFYLNHVGDLVSEYGVDLDFTGTESRWLQTNKRYISLAPDKSRLYRLKNFRGISAFRHELKLAWSELYNVMDISMKPAYEWGTLCRYILFGGNNILAFQALQQLITNCR